MEQDLTPGQQIAYLTEVVGVMDQRLDLQKRRIQELETTVHAIRDELAAVKRSPALIGPLGTATRYKGW